MIRRNPFCQFITRLCRFCLAIPTRHQAQSLYDYVSCISETISGGVGYTTVCAKHLQHRCILPRAFASFDSLYLFTKYFIIHHLLDLLFQSRGMSVVRLRSLPSSQTFHNRLHHFHPCACYNTHPLGSNTFTRPWSTQRGLWKRSCSCKHSHKHP